jgi:integrin beta 8
VAGSNGTNGVDGQDGASAYETWLSLGNTGSEADFIASLTGPQGATGPQGIQGSPGVAGTNGANGVDGQNGASAYETWLSLVNTGSEADFVASLSGPQGPAGNDGATGPQGIQGTQGIQGPAGVDGANGTNGVDGQDGASAYETWLSLGNTGTEADFIASLTGPQGPAGNDGATGPQGPIGLTGPQGLQGVQGPAGPAGQGGVTTAGSNVTVTGTGIVGDPYVINADDNDWIINANDLYNANPGNIGIGTSTPSQLLELRGNDPNLLINSNSGAAYLQVNSAPSAEAGIQFQANGGNVWTMFRPSNTNDLRFYDGGFRVTFQNGGNVGIGTTAPEGILDVSSTTSGVIMPRMTAAQRDAIAVPVNGMMVYNTDENCMNFYQAGAWASFCGGGSGGSGSSSGSNANTLIYTTDGF